MRQAVLLVAGGTGTRMGSPKPKQFLRLNQYSILVETLNRFLDWNPEILPAIVSYPEVLEELNTLLDKEVPAEIRNKILICPGGNTRTVSVWNGIQLVHTALQGENAWVAIHDAVRPLVSSELLDNNQQIATEKGNAVACVPVTNSLRKITPEGTVAVNREEYFLVQTPQTFRLKDIYQWLKNRPHDQFTDEASLAEYFGATVNLSPGSYQNIKITTPADLYLARYISQNPNKPLE
jgi:2-C-methyl-D-erythritol 4-phosphate cytidylyltransferase